MTFTTTHAATLADIITSGDISFARTYLTEWCAGRAWSQTEAAAIRGACSRWGIDPADFRAAAPPRRLDAGSLALRASLMLAPVPSCATDGDFQIAAMQAAAHPDEPAFSWRMEAIRFRLHHPTKALDLDAVFAATVDTLALWRRRGMAA